METIAALQANAAIIAFAAFGAGGALVALLYPWFTRQAAYDSRFAAIAGATARAAQGRRDDGHRRKRSVEETLREIDERQRRQTRRSKAKPSLMGRMRQAQLGWSKKTYYLVCLATGLFCFLMTIMLGIGALPAVGFGFAGGLLLPHLYVGFLRRRRFARFGAEFPTAVDVIVRGVKSGLPLGDCMKIIAAEAQEPVRSEFKTLVEDQTLGMPIDEAVLRLANRMPLSEANFFAIVIGIQMRTGGSLSEALGNLSKVLRERKKMHGKIKAMSQEAKSSAAIIGALPPVVATFVYFTSPDYIMLLFSETIGNIVLVGCALWMGIGVAVMRKMINFDF
ncbi:type II secretion system F family protein [Consotaella aegiceratis]|uniref:type II secretion system F family protein n=1 Tax=Consotaella aegiceratis TaxID=3097961 RepID=UPI002F3F2581